MSATNLICKTAAYRPLVITSKDENSVGDTISGSTGTPAGYYGCIGLDLSTAAPGQVVSNVNFSYLSNALAGSGILVQDSQFVRCATGFASIPSTPTLRNVLVYRVDTLVNADYEKGGFGGDILTGENVTAHYCTNFMGDPTSTVYLTNCLFVCVTNWQCYLVRTNSSVFLDSDTGVFQAAGGGGHYLPPDSPYLGAGTTSINAALLSGLRQKTTRVPCIYSASGVQYISTNLILSPQVRRDAGPAIDLGFHYSPIDYAFSYTYFTNATITVSPGTVVTSYRASLPGGLAIASSARLLCQGLATNLVRFVDAASVQEEPDWAGRGLYAFLVGCWQSGMMPASINCWFTDFSSLARDCKHMGWGGGNLLPVNLRDCQLHGGYIENQFTTITMTNCLLERVSADFEPMDYYAPVLRNNLFYGGTFFFSPWYVTNGIIMDNLFDQTSIPYGTYGYVSAFNAFVTNCDRLDFTDATDIVLPASPAYQTGPLGNYYQLSNSILINADINTTAGQAGLYHYTVCTNLVNGCEIKETNSWLDVGLHYVAVDSNGVPIDADGGGVPDYIENGAGDGATNNLGESNWQDGSDDYNYLVTPGYLRVEYRQNPWGVDAKDPWTGQQKPRFFWVVNSARRAQKQLAYQVLVATSTNNLNAGYGDMWDSGRVWGDQTIHVEYNGATLQSGQRLWWKVRTWDLYTGLPSPWSTNAFFQMGLLNTNDWGAAKWIGVNGYKGNYPCPMFRSQAFVLSNQIATATAYVSAKGVYELWINGCRIGPNILAPEWTDYNQRVQYQTYDVTPYLTNGTAYASNVIGAFLGEGWCYGKTDYGNYYGDPNPQFLLRLNIVNSDASLTNILTDSSWSCSTNGPILSASIYDGESYDGRREGATTNWSMAGYNLISFTNSAVLTSVDPSKLSAQPNNSVKIVQLIQPIGMWPAVNQNGEPATVFDMGQNMVGFCKLSIVNTNGIYGSGSNVVLRHAEVLTLNSGNYGACGPFQTNIFTGNLWNALQIDRYTLNGETNQQFQPHFTYHGFRYVELTAPSAVAAFVTTNSIVGCVIHSSVPLTGAFVCYDTNFANPRVDPLLTNNPVSKLVTNSVWALRGNLQGVFTACTQRAEREGYMYDEHIFSQTACFNADMGAFLTKWIRDMRDAQGARGDGGYTLISPYDNFPYVRLSDTDPGAQAAGLIFPWRLYQNYGDARMLAEHYASGANWLKLITNTYPQYLWNNMAQTVIQDGKSADWYGVHPYGWRPDSTIMGSTHSMNWGTAWYAGAADLMAGIARAMQQESLKHGQTSNVNFYADQCANYGHIAANVRSAYMGLTNDIKHDPQGRITNLFWNTQADCTMALAFDMIPAGQRESVLDILLNSRWGIRNFNYYYGSSNHLSTGYYTSPRTMLELTRDGRTDVAYRILMNAEFPSWTYGVTNGFTTGWEEWNTYLAGPPNPNAGFNDRGYYLYYGGMICSFSHLILAAVGEWVWETVGGINPDENRPGYKNTVLKPEPGGGITNAFALFTSIGGPILCSWTNDAVSTNYWLNVTVPANCTATVLMPSNSVARITESGLINGSPAISAPGVFGYYFTNSPNWSNGALVLQVGSGAYAFRSSGVSP